MILKKIKIILCQVKNAMKIHSDGFLKDVTGVVHIGANVGQERWRYNKLDLQVIWIEPIPEVFSELKENIKDFSGQRALQALVTDIDGKEYQFHVANNRGASSSIFDFKQHKDIWPDVTYLNSISLTSVTLTSLLRREQIDPCQFQALTIDTQGSELLVLQGSLPILNNFKYINTEVADFESYEGCCQLADINAFMDEHGYEEISRKKFANRAAGGSYFDIVYRKGSV